MRAFAGRLNNIVLVVVALLVSAHAAFSASGLGDYPGDAATALRALLSGDLRAFGQARPAMGDVSLLLRAPFAAIAYIGHAHPTELSIYRWGVLPCVLSVAVLALWLARIASRRGTGPVGVWAIVLVSLVNPLVTSAIALGHPEELLTGSLCIGALVAAFERRLLLTTALLGLALACKQWSIVAILPILLVLERARVRTLLWALAVAVLATLPEVIGAPASFLRNQLSLTQHAGRVPSVWSWWWPPAPNRTLHVAVGGSYVTVSDHSLPRALVQSLHALTISVDVLVAAVVARVRRLPLRLDDGFALMAVILLLRCTLDSETMPYYHAPLFLDLLAWDALRGERLPIRALAAAAVSYVLFDRLTPPLIGGASSFLYAGCTVAALILLARTLAGRSASSPRRLGSSLPASV